MSFDEKIIYFRERLNSRAYELLGEGRVAEVLTSEIKAGDYARKAFKPVGYALSAASLFTLLACGCGGVDEEEAEKAPKSPSLECLTCETDATFNNNFAGIGGFGLGITDKKWLADCQGFDFFEGHEGGYGDTLEIVGCENSMYLHWSYDMLGQITLYSEWNGKVQGSNIRIGDSLDVFRAAYPQAKQCPGMDRWYHELKGKSLEVDIDVNGKINRINIDFGSCWAY